LRDSESARAALARSSLPALLRVAEGPKEDDGHSLGWGGARQRAGKGGRGADRTALPAEHAVFEVLPHCQLLHVALREPCAGLEQAAQFDFLAEIRIFFSVHEDEVRVIWIQNRIGSQIFFPRIVYDRLPC
jgi:hypothetical protein